MMLVCLASSQDEHVVQTDGTVDRWASGRDDTSSRRLTGNLKSSIFFAVQSLLKMLWQVESIFTVFLHISDFVQTQDEAKILSQFNIIISLNSRIGRSPTSGYLRGTFPLHYFLLTYFRIIKYLPLLVLWEPFWSMWLLWFSVQANLYHEPLGSVHSQYY
jgi:hypothetical protein